MSIFTLSKGYFFYEIILFFVDNANEVSRKIPIFAAVTENNICV